MQIGQQKSGQPRSGGECRLKRPAKPLAGRRSRAAGGRRSKAAWGRRSKAVGGRRSKAAGGRRGKAVPRHPTQYRLPVTPAP